MAVKYYSLSALHEFLILRFFCMGENIHLFSSAWSFFGAKIHKGILAMSLNCNVHLAEQKLVDLT